MTANKRREADQHCATRTLFCPQLEEFERSSFQSATVGQPTGTEAMHDSGSSTQASLWGLFVREARNATRAPQREKERWCVCVYMTHSRGPERLHEGIALVLKLTSPHVPFIP